MSSSSFLGQNLRVKLQSGDSVQGKITSIDAVTGNLGLLKIDGRFQSLNRGDIVDLELLPQEMPKKAAQQSPASSSSSARPSKPAIKDPAILSHHQPPPPTYASTLHKSKISEELPRAPAAMLNKLEKASIPLMAESKGRERDKKGTASAEVAESLSNIQTEEENGYGSVPQVQKRMKKKQARKVPVISSTEESDLEQDFDFDKALQSFDKRKIWQEIKTIDQTDPNSLLISHNRINGCAKQQDGIGHRSKRGGQDKLGLHEPVLSPSPTGSQSSLPTMNTSVTLQGRQPNEKQEELQKIRGKALQREVENSRLKDEIKRLESKVKVLEALGGVEMQWTADMADGDRWKGTIYESLSAHAEARRTPQRAAKGSLVFLLRTFTDDAARLRYLGLVSDECDSQVVERLPPQYKNEMGLKTESASVFVRRIKEAIQPK